VCKYVTTVRTDSRQYNNFDSNTLRKIYSPPSERNTCSQCKAEVFHEYLYTSELSNKTESYLSVFHTSLLRLHTRAIQKYQQHMRRCVEEKINHSREMYALKLGRQLTEQEISDIWKNYTCHHRAILSTAK